MTPRDTQPASIDRWNATLTGWGVRDASAAALPPLSGDSDQVLTPAEADKIRACTCRGSGLVRDVDGTVTGMIGWPLPCPCIDEIPASVCALPRPAARLPRSALYDVYGGAA